MLLFPVRRRVPLSQVTKESLHEVVGSLGLEQDRGAGPPHRNGIGKELVVVFVDLRKEGLPVRAGLIVGAGSQLVAEALHRPANGASATGGCPS